MKTENKYIMLLFALIFVILFVSAAYYPHMMGYGMYGFGIFGLIIGIIFWAVIIYLAYILLRNATMNKESGLEESGLEILNKRYARGEISKKEYELVKKDLTSNTKIKKQK
jgi:putative membrane protein